MSLNTIESLKTSTRFAGSRFSDAPNPSLLPKPPLHWINANAINDSGGDPRDRLKTLTTNGLNVHNITDPYSGVDPIHRLKTLKTNGIIGHNVHIVKDFRDPNLGVDPMDLLKTMTTNGIIGHNINGLSPQLSDPKRHKSVENNMNSILFDCIKSVTTNL